MSGRIAIVGGGIAGLAAAVYLARAGKSVTLFERRRNLGGRAVTHLRRGFRFNLGPHAVYKGGAAAKVYRELGVPIRGGTTTAKGLALHGGSLHRLPSGFLSLFMSSLLSAKAKAEWTKLYFKLPGLDPAAFRDITAREWLDRNISDERLRELMEAFMRLSTYANAADRQSAEVALRQLILSQRGVVYLHEGWQKIVDALHSHAVTAGVTFITSAHVVKVEHDGGAVQAIEIGELELEDRKDTVSLALPEQIGGDSGTRIPTATVVLAVDPATAAALMEDRADFARYQQVTVSSLDVALSRLPSPKRTFALGIDQPLYYSVHSQWAQLTPKGGALIHVARYRNSSDAPDEQELEAFLDQMQPGWREVVVHKRFLPSLVASNALVEPGMKRPGVQTALKGLFLAGDWVGDEGILSDAALSSARAAAQAIIAQG